jgi:hypothetical protein
MLVRESSPSNIRACPAISRRTRTPSEYSHQSPCATAFRRNTIRRGQHDGARAFSAFHTGPGIVTLPGSRCEYLPTRWVGAK